MTSQNNIEVEIRSFIDDDQYKRLRDYFTKNAELLMEDEQETVYLSGDEDIRIQRGNHQAKIWMKSGQVHDDAREETEVQFDPQDYDKVVKIFLAMGNTVDIKWLRHRFQFDWDGIDVSLDDTKGYGKIIELEKMCGPDQRDAALTELHNHMQQLDVRMTPREQFDQRYEEYQHNWHKLI